MLLKIWRTSHMLIAIIGATFFILLIVSGVILSVEPIHSELKQFNKRGAKNVPLTDLFTQVQQEYEAVLEIEVLDNYAVKVSAIDEDPEKDGDFFIDPFTGKKMGEIPPKNKFFQTIANFHRSLFLKTTGRIIVGFTSFLFLLSIITGILLLAKRDGGLRFLFKHTLKTNLSQYVHVVISKWTWIPLAILALTGVYLSLLRFEYIPDKELIQLAVDTLNEESPQIAISDFPALQGLKLASLEKVEFPFSEDEIDPYTIQLKDQQILINQYTGQVMEAYQVPLLNRISDWSFALHTGAGSIPWAIILGLCTLGSLFLLYFGLVITYKRLSTRLPKKYSPNESTHILLFGSENGATKSMAIALYKSFLANGQKVFIDELNNYRTYPKMESLTILTSTYGDGEAPSNAHQFLDKLHHQAPLNPCQYAVLGFGSHAYPEFCKYAIDVEAQLAAHPQFQALAPLRLIHNQSQAEFIEWSKSISPAMGTSLGLAEHLKLKVPKLSAFKVIDRQLVVYEGEPTYLLRLKPLRKQGFQSGDLLNFYPKEEPSKRSYSIGKDKQGHILLAIKRHEYGIVSNYLMEVPIGEEVLASIEHNPHFHLPKKYTKLHLIANGTGIGPFLGMVQHKGKADCHLYWGTKSSNTFLLYQDILEQAIEKQHLQSFASVFSREKGGDRYVQDLILKKNELLANDLNNGGKVMICGSLAMQKDVMQVLDQITLQYLEKPISYFEEKGQILSDCY